MDDRQKVLNLIGLATKAGKTASGEFMTEKSVKSGKAFLVIVSEEASDNTRKMFTNMCTYYEVPIYFFGKKSDLFEYASSISGTEELFRAFGQRKAGEELLKFIPIKIGKDRVFK